MSLTRESVRAAVERGGDEQMQLLRKHHEDAYPASRPTPGDICKSEAERLNALGLGDAPSFSLTETRVERVGNEVRLVHVFEYGPQRVRLVSEPFTNYG